MTKEKGKDPGALAAGLEISAYEHQQQIPVQMIATAMRDGQGDYVREVSDALGQMQLQAWEAGFEVAVRIARHMGAHVVAADMEEALAGYWRSQGVEEDK